MIPYMVHNNFFFFLQNVVATLEGLLIAYAIKIAVSVFANPESLEEIANNLIKLIISQLFTLNFNLKQKTVTPHLEAQSDMIIPNISFQIIRGKVTPYFLIFRYAFIPFGFFKGKKN